MHGNGLATSSSSISRLVSPLSLTLALCAAAATALAQAPQAATQAKPTRSEPAAAAGFALRDGDRVVFYGDSITQDGGYCQLVEAYVTTRFPHWDVSFENAGVGGDTVRGGWAGTADVRLERDVIARRPTVVSIMLGMNDGGYRRFDPTTLAAFGDGYAAIVHRLQQALPGVRLTFIRSSPFDDVSRKPQFAPGYDDALRRLGCYLATLGGREKATVADFRTPLNEGLAALVGASPDLARQLIPDRVHPSPAGHAVMAAALLRAWGAPALVARVEIDGAAKAVVAAENTEVTGLAAAGGGLAWTQLDGALPLPVSFDDATTELAQKAGADLESLDGEPLVVRGLAPGNYELKIDGQSIGRFTGDELATGVNLATRGTPQRRQAFTARWSIEDSHRLQLLRRRLLASGSGDPKTAEVVAFLDAQDEAARKARRAESQPKARKYELMPVR
jgi:lysophospholipase L1-like esterase